MRIFFRSLMIMVTACFAVPGFAQQDLLPLHQEVQIAANSIPFIVAQEEGIYRKNGLDVDQCIARGVALRRTRSGMRVPPELVCPPRSQAGPISIMGGGPRIVEQMLQADASDTVILATFDHMTNWTLLSRKDITSLEQLRGKRLGQTGYGNISHFMAMILAQAMGWDIRSRDIILVAGQREIDNLRNGDVDAILVVEMVAINAIEEGFHPLIDLREWKVPMVGNGLNVNRAWLRDNRETASRLIKSLVDAIALVKKDKQVAYRAMAKWYDWSEPEKQAQLFEYVEAIPRKPYPAVEGIERYLKAYFPDGVWPLEPSEFYQDSFVRELDQSGYIDSLYE